MLKDKLKVHSGTDNLEAVRDAEVIFLCVKPQVVVDVVREIRTHVNRGQPNRRGGVAPNRLVQRSAPRPSRQLLLQLNGLFAVRDRPDILGRNQPAKP